MVLIGHGSTLYYKSKILHKKFEYNVLLYVRVNTVGHFPSRINPWVGQFSKWEDEI